MNDILAASQWTSDHLGLIVSVVVTVAVAYLLFRALSKLVAVVALAIIGPILFGIVAPVVNDMADSVDPAAGSDSRSVTRQYPGLALSDVDVERKDGNWCGSGTASYKNSKKFPVKVAIKDTKVRLYSPSKVGAKHLAHTGASKGFPAACK